MSLIEFFPKGWKMLTQSLAADTIPDMRFHEKLSDLIALYKSRRKLRGESCADEDVAEALSALGAKVRKSNLNYWRRGQKELPRLNDLRAMAQLFDVSIEYLVRDDITDPNWSCCAEPAAGPTHPNRGLVSTHADDQERRERKERKRG